VPATSEAQTTPISAPDPPRPRTPIAEPTLARADSKLGEGYLKPSPGAAISLESGTRSAAIQQKTTPPIVPAQPESPANGGAGGNALGGLSIPRSEVPEPAVAKAQAAPGAVEASNRGAALEPAVALDGGASETVSAVAGHRDEPGPLDLDTVRKLWPELAKKVDKRLALTLTQVEPIDLEGSDVLVIAVKPGYNSTFADIDSPEAQSKIAQALQRLVHRPMRIKYIRRFVDEHGEAEARRNEARRADSLSKDPMVQRVLELFEARPVQMDYGEDDASPEN
jgi:hypothetical protein